MTESWPAAMVIVITTLVFVVLGVSYVRRRTLTVEEYIVSRNSADPAVATATLVASVIGAWVLFSPAETATWAGIIGVIGYGIGQAAPLVALVFIGPKMRRMMPQGHSLTEYVWHRYGRYMYLFVLVVIVFYMFVFLSAELTGIAFAVQLLSDTPLWATALIVGSLTVAYTAYGGIRASIFTDTIQFFLILPLLLIGFVVAIMSMDGFGAALGRAWEETPHLLSPTHRPGIEFAVTLIIAILAANMFHQGFWQRVYTCRDERSLRRGFSMAGLLVVPIVVVAGLFGLMATGIGVPADQGSVALFYLVSEIIPSRAVPVFLILAVILVMSSMDTLLNGIASAITSDLARYRPSLRANVLLRSSRGVTIFLIFPAIFIAARGYSVLYLFLVADLVCAAALVPVFLGLYSKRFSGRAALISSIAGLVMGALIFPAPDGSAWNALPLAGSYLLSFSAAVGVSALLSTVFVALAGKLGRLEDEYDFERLRAGVRLIQG